MPENRSANILQIRKGKLGSVSRLPKAGLEIKPLTVFIGKQGTGKSLFSQLAYFFYNLPYLATYQQELQRNGVSSQALIRAILDNLRSDRRAFAVFADPSATIQWGEFKVHLEQRTRQVKAWKALEDYVQGVVTGKVALPPFSKALFVPAERVMFPHASPSAWRLFSWPTTLTLYGDALKVAEGIAAQWENNKPSTAAGRLIRRVSQEALGGEGVKRGDIWRWRMTNQKLIDLDMASSGQKANWSWLLLAEVLFEQQAQLRLETPFRIHIEEPEIHLHPAAQRSMMRILVYMVNQGFEVLLTTHSLTMLYELNNLLAAAARLPVSLVDERVPAPEFRIGADKVAAYWFREDGQVQSLLQFPDLALEGEAPQPTPWIDEDQLRQVDEALGQELARIRAYGTFWGQEANAKVASE